MKRLSIALVALVALAASIALPVRGENIRELAWEDLAPRVEFEDPYEGLSSQQIGDFSFVYWMVQRQQLDLEIGEAERVRLDERYQQAIHSLVSAGLDLDSLVARQEEIEERQRIASSTVVTDLDTLTVSIPGYALPLEYSDNTRVTEFLLVPYVGACIHTPPPPSNQIVHVKSSQGLEIRSLFEPVLVSGTLSIQHTEQELEFVDGAAAIDVGYALQANQIEFYEDRR